MSTEYKSKLLRRSDSLVTRDVVKIDVFVHEPQVLADVREALEVGLKPVAFSLIGDAVVLRLERQPVSRAGCAERVSRMSTQA